MGVEVGALAKYVGASFAGVAPFPPVGIAEVCVGMRALGERGLAAAFLTGVAFLCTGCSDAGMAA